MTATQAIGNPKHAFFIELPQPPWSNVAELKLKSREALLPESRSRQKEIVGCLRATASLMSQCPERPAFAPGADSSEARMAALATALASSSRYTGFASTG